MNIVEFDTGCYVGKKAREHSYGPFITSETTFPEAHISDWHYHKNPHYSHILSGGSQEISLGSKQRQGEGDGLYYFPGIPHQNSNYLSGTKIFNLEIGEEFFDTCHVKIPAEAVMFSDLMAANSLGLLKILKEHRLNDQHSRLAIEQLTIELITTYPGDIKNYPEWAAKIKTVLNDHWKHCPTLPELAAMVEIHPVTLSKYFSRYFNCTLGEYLRKIKISRALKMIRSDDCSLTQIAYACGFADQSHFTKTFNFLTGMLPKQYRAL